MLGRLGGCHEPRLDRDPEGKEQVLGSLERKESTCGEMSSSCTCRALVLLLTQVPAH